MNVLYSYRDSSTNERVQIQNECEMAVARPSNVMGQRGRSKNNDEAKILFRMASFNSIKPLRKFYKYYKNKFISEI